MKTLDAWQGWVEFWQKFANFFWVADSSGLNYLARIGISIALIVVTWLLLKLLTLGLKKAFKIKKGPDIDASAKLIIIGLIKFLIWIGIGFAVCSILKINLSGMGGIVASIGVALGLALQDLLRDLIAGISIIFEETFCISDDKRRSERCYL